MPFEINVAQLSKRAGSVGKYEHFFATHPRSLNLGGKVKKVYEAIKAAFPAPEFAVTVARVTETGVPVDPAKLTDND